MATVNYDGDGFFVVSESVANGNSMTFDASQSNTGVLEVHSISHGEDCDVFLELDSNGDGSFDRSVQLDSFTGEGGSFRNKIEVLQTQDMRVKIDNTGSTTADFVCTGAEL